MLEMGRGLMGRKELENMYILDTFSIHCKKINPFPPDWCHLTWWWKTSNKCPEINLGHKQVSYKCWYASIASVTWRLARVNNTTLVYGHQHMAIVQEKRLILQIVLFNLNIQQQHVLRNMRWYWENNCLWWILSMPSNFPDEMINIQIIMSVPGV